MIENHYYADVNLPNHVWVRERAGTRARWVLRDASELQKGTGYSRPRGAAERSGSPPGGSSR